VLIRLFHCPPEPACTMVRTFYLGEITSRSTAPFHEYLISTESAESKENKTSCLFTEVKRNAGHAIKVPASDSSSEPVKDPFDEAFIDYARFINVIEKKDTPPHQPETVRG
jgi:hypothetical protein